MKEGRMKEEKAIPDGQRFKRKGACYNVVVTLRA